MHKSRLAASEILLMLKKFHQAAVLAAGEIFAQILLMRKKKKKVSPGCWQDFSHLAVDDIFLHVQNFFLQKSHQRLLYVQSSKGDFCVCIHLPAYTEINADYNVPQPSC